MVIFGRLLAALGHDLAVIINRELSITRIRAPRGRIRARCLAEERGVSSMDVRVGPGDRHEDARGAPRTPRSPGSLPPNRRGSLMRQANRGYTHFNRHIKIGEITAPT